MERIVSLTIHDGDNEEVKGDPVFERAPPSSHLLCVKCGTNFGDAEQHQILFLEECCHVVCKICLKAAITASFPEEVFCPGQDCEAKLADYEVRDVLG